MNKIGYTWMALLLPRGFGEYHSSFLLGLTLRFYSELYSEPFYTELYTEFCLKAFFGAYIDLFAVNNVVNHCIVCGNYF